MDLDQLSLECIAASVTTDFETLTSSFWTGTQTRVQSLDVGASRWDDPLFMNLWHNNIKWFLHLWICKYSLFLCFWFHGQIDTIEISFLFLRFIEFQIFYGEIWHCFQSFKSDFFGIEKYRRNYQIFSIMGIFVSFEDFIWWI